MANFVPASFNPVKGYWFTSFLLKTIESKIGCYDVTLDIGLTYRTICVHGGLITVDGNNIPINDVKPSEEDRIVLVEEGSSSVYEVLMHTDVGFYKLKAIEIDKAPTIEINGIHMHRISGTDPWSDTILKIRAARVKKGMRVLDTCMGLGYTSIISLNHGAREVYTFEIDPIVKWIAERNPWSHSLSDPRVKLITADVTRFVTSLPGNYFDRIIHDPPRFTKQTGYLYSYEFYLELNRVLRPGGVLFHYTGEPHKHGGPRILKGVKERLEKAGFKIIKYDRKALGFVGFKPIWRVT
ncbi:MAG: methyltransferase [Desulfurococcaceae archaeon]